MENIRSKEMFAAFVSGLAVLVTPVLFAFWEIVNDPVFRADGTVDDGAERGAAIFLLYFTGPLLLALFVYFILLAAYSIHKQETVFVRVTRSAGYSCICIAIRVSLFFYKFGFVFQVKAFLVSLLALAIGLSPGVLTLWAFLRSA